jgi:hypothetical protein
MVYVVFGYDDSWYFVNDDDTMQWSSNLPDHIFKLLNGRYNSRQHHNALPRAVSFTDEGYFVQFQDGRAASFGSDYFNELSSGWQDVFCISQTSEQQYVALHRDGVSWRNIPFRMEQLIQTRNQHDVTWAQIGSDDSWFLKFSDGTAFWGGNVSDSLDEHLHSDQAIDRVFLSPCDDNYFVEFSNGSTSWSASHDFTLDYKAIMNGYDRERSDQPFGDHHIWRHEDTGDVIEWWGTTQTCKTTVKYHPRDGGAKRRRRGNPYNKDLVRDNIDVHKLTDIFRNIRAHTGTGRYWS